MNYLLDTDICIYVIRKKPAQVLRRIAACAVGDIGISTVTIAELHYGVEKSIRVEQNQTALEQFLLPLAVVAFDYAAARAYGRIRTALERSGTPIGALDMLIAAHALSLNVTLVTNNTKEFSCIPALHVEDWTAD
jgi:tRNA(fMet)-specific endonuclease VapC